MGCPFNLRHLICVVIHPPQIAGSISFIPNRPRECMDSIIVVYCNSPGFDVSWWTVVSGGYDSCLNHYDLTTRSTISHLDLGKQYVVLTHS